MHADPIAQAAEGLVKRMHFELPWAGITPNGKKRPMLACVLYKDYMEHVVCMVLNRLTQQPLADRLRQV